MSEEIVVADIGGTHARFAIAEISNGAVLRLDQAVTLKTAAHASLQSAWEAFGDILGRKLPRAVAIGLATSISGDVLKLTNNPWIIQRTSIDEKLQVDRHILLNDFGVVAHAVATLPDNQFTHIAGPDEPLRDKNVVSVIGPGTGLGVASLILAKDHYHVVEAEGGHIEYAPLDVIEDAILLRLRQQFTRVSVERVVSGPGLSAIHQTLAELAGCPPVELTDADLWALALEGRDNLAVAVFDRFCRSFGSVAGDIVMAQGGRALVIAGGLGLRISEYLGQSGFIERFVAKGRFQQLMETIPVYVITHPQPGLYGAAAAFAQEHRQ